MARYVVTAGYVTAETAVPGGRASVDIPRGALLPEDVPAETVESLLGLGRIEAIAEAPAPAVEPVPEPGVDPDAVPAGTVVEVLAWVGGDLERAARALEVEQAEGGPGRKGVMEPLGEMLAAQD